DRSRPPRRVPLPHEPENPPTTHRHRRTNAFIVALHSSLRHDHRMDANASSTITPRGKKVRIAFFALLMTAIVATFAGEKLGFIRNVAVDDKLVARAPDQAVAAVRSAAAAMLRWTQVRDDGTVLEWEAHSALLDLVDDVRIEVVPEGQGTRLHLRSTSRV